MKILFVLIFALLVIGSAGTAQAEVNININLGSEPPAVVMMPRMGIYFVPGISYDVFFYNGYWWYPSGNRWYRASQYKGPWGVVQYKYVPGLLFKVPKNYRTVYKNERSINYKQWKSNYGQPKKQAGQWKTQGGRPKKQGGGNQGRGRGH